MELVYEDVKLDRWISAKSYEPHLISTLADATLTESSIALITDESRAFCKVAS